MTIFIYLSCRKCVFLQERSVCDGQVIIWGAACGSLSMASAKYLRLWWTVSSPTVRVKRSNGLWMFPTILPPIHVLFFVHCFSVSVFLSFVCASVIFVLALPSNEISAGIWLMLQILNAQTVSHPSCDDYNPDAHPYGHTGSSSLTGKGKVWSRVSIKDQWRLYI